MLTCGVHSRIHRVLAHFMFRAAIVPPSGCRFYDAHCGG